MKQEFNSPESSNEKFNNVPILASGFMKKKAMDDDSILEEDKDGDLDMELG